MTPPLIAIHAAGATANDALFDVTAPANRDDCLRGFREFREQVEAAGGQVHTHDVLVAAGRVPDVVLFLDVPATPVDRLVPRWPDAKRWVVLQECEVVLPRNWQRALHGQFDLVFTWHPDWIDGARYRRLDFANPLAPPREGHPFHERQLATLVAGNKRSSHPLELYSARLDTIRWFEANAPEDFEFFGIGWDRRRFGGPLRALNVIDPLARYLAPKWPSWRGRVDDKLDTMSGFRFTICYENAREIPGYVTEKLFDAMSAGTVPVYWGAPDIADRVPMSCFIDRRVFPDHQALAQHLRSVDEDAFLEYRTAISEFLGSDSARPYSAREYGRVLASAALEAVD